MRSRTSSLLPWIVAFKAAKAALPTTFGVMLLFVIHRDPVDLVLQLAEAVHLPPASRLVRPPPRTRRHSTECLGDTVGVHDQRVSVLKADGFFAEAGFRKQPQWWNADLKAACSTASDQ
jgi:predicted membrane protein DUF2127